jgi:protein-S-isoprenylcysteine O-methyltransferase Ste14
MGLKTIWIDFLFNTATGTKKVRTLLTPIGVVIFGLFVITFVVIATKVDKVLYLPTTSNFYVSIPLIFLGFILTGWSILHFLKVKGTPVPINPPPKLVSSGPYSFARNPMLTGIFLVMFGIGFWIGSLSLILVFTPVFILVNTLELKNIEEPELERRLGRTYIEYKKHTPMFIPRFNNILQRKK